MAKPKTTFAPMPGGVLNAENVIIAGKELQRIERKHGAIKPADVVTESRPEDAPLHPHFTWDDTIAAENWRQDEARNIIRSVRVITQPELPHAEQTVVRAYVSVRASEAEESFEGKGYISSQRAVSIDAYREQMLADAKAAIKMFEHKYRDLLTFCGAQKAVETLVEGLEKMKTT